MSSWTNDTADMLGTFFSGMRMEVGGTRARNNAAACASARAVEALGNSVFKFDGFGVHASSVQVLEFSLCVSFRVLLLRDLMKDGGVLGRDGWND